MIPAEYAGVYIGRILKSDARPGLTGVANTPIEAFVMKHDCIYHQYRVEWRKDTNPEQVNNRLDIMVLLYLEAPFRH